MFDNITTQEIYQALLLVLNLILFVYFTKKVLNRLKKVKDNYKKIESLEKNKCKGPHSWISVIIKGIKTPACKICYWCPAHDAFVKESYINETIQIEKFNTEYKKFIEEKIQLISEKYKIDTNKLLNIEKELSELKQNFSNEYFKKMLEEMIANSEKSDD